MDYQWQESDVVEITLDGGRSWQNYFRIDNEDHASFWVREVTWSAEMKRRYRIIRFRPNQTGFDVVYV